MTLKPTRDLIWFHNGLLGRVSMARQAARAVIEASTTTEESRLIAVKLSQNCEELLRSLKTRRDQEPKS